MIKQFEMFIFLVVGLGFQSFAQDQKDTPYYISLNTADGKSIHKISDETLSLQYNDPYGDWKKIPLKIFNWKHELITTLNIDKTYGLNSFVIKLNTVHDGWEINKVYTCELTDEAGRKFDLPIKLTPPLEKNEPEVTIHVNPIHSSCDGLSQNIVEFYGAIAGGKAPYLIDWFVLNANATDFLYQPRQETIESAGKTMVITVDKNPDYYVALFVRDACGNSQRKIVNFTCQEGSKKINTVFVEELNSPLLNPRKIN